MGFSLLSWSCCNSGIGLQRLPLMVAVWIPYSRACGIQAAIRLTDPVPYSTDLSAATKYRNIGKMFANLLMMFTMIM